MIMFGRSRDLLAQLERERDDLAARVDALQKQRSTDLQLLDGLGEGLLAIDRNRHVVIANRRFGDLFGASDIIGKPLSEVLRVSDVFDAFDAALKGNESTVQFSVRAGVAERKIEMRALPLASAEIAAIALFIDISTIERLEQIRRNFISDFSHEVRTPLAGLRSAVETLEANPDRLSPEDDHQLRRIMARQLRRLERLVDDLSELSRIESGDLTLDIRSVDLRRLLDDLAEDFADQAAQHRVRFVVEGDATVSADPHRLQQAFSNLLDNAIKYGGDEHQVTMKIEEKGDAGIVRVSDQGEGIPRGEREKIFRRFYRIDKSRSQDIAGSGLGLAITKHLVLQQRGSIDVESEPGKGATFIVRLPKAR
jgi:two-component system, OmpR family, phosphate regulon sensor histidine kinase PhoR